MPFKVPAPVSWPPPGPKNPGVDAPPGFHAVRPEVIRRTVGFRLPPGSLVVDVAWQQRSPLDSFADRYSIIAVTADDARAVHAPGLRADRLCLPFADSSVDCVLLLDLTEDDVRDGGVMTEAKRMLCPGGLVAVTASSAHGARNGVRHRLVWRRGATAHVSDALVGLGLVPEQVNHVQFVLHPSKLVATTADRLPLLCRIAAVLNRLDPSRLAQVGGTRASAVLVLGRKP